MLNKIAHSLFVVAVSALLFSCAEVETVEEDRPLVIQTPSPITPMPELRNVPQTLMEFHGYADPGNNVFALWPAEYPESIVESRYLGGDATTSFATWITLNSLTPARP